MATAITVDLGDVYPLGITTRNPAEQPEDAGAVTLTITLPDGTTTSPTISHTAGTGVYTADYPTVQAGRHTARWVATGVNASAFTDVFDVLAAADVGILSLAAAKAHLNITITGYDEELRGFIRAVTYVIEGKVGAVVRRTYTDEVPGGYPVIVLPRSPVLSVTSITPILTGVTAVTMSDLDVATSGIVRHKTGLPISAGPLRAVYVAGLTIVPENFALASKIILAHMWETQRGGGRRPSLGGEDEVVAAAQTYSIPRRALELLEQDTVSGFA